MKKLVAILCALLCIMSLAACSSDDAIEQKKAQSRAYLEEEKDKSVENLFSMYLNVFALLSDTDRVVSEEEKVFTYETLSQMSNDEVENFLSGVDGHGFKTALESFYLTRKTTGAINSDPSGSVTYSDFKLVKNGDQILARATVQCANGPADVELIFSNDLLLILEGGSLNARFSAGELMEKAALNTLIGMGTVFSVLILISLIIACFGLIPKIQAAFAKKEEAPEPPAAPVIETPAVTVEEEDDTELVAVIAAAIAAYEGSTNTDGFVVRSIRRR